MFSIDSYTEFTDIPEDKSLPPTSMNARKEEEREGVREEELVEEEKEEDEGEEEIHILLTM